MCDAYMISTFRCNIIGKKEINGADEQMILDDDNIYIYTIIIIVDYADEIWMERMKINRGKNPQQHSHTKKNNNKIRLEWIEFKKR